MLDCKRDRLDYGELLRPPEGYRLDRAVATSYSADLGTLLSIPIALVYAQTLEGDLSGARFQLLEAIKQFSGRVKVYHQLGQLHVPSKLNWLHAYLEDALAPVLPADAFTSFHPKVWIIRYAAVDEDLEKQSDPSYRVIVLSRNLTFDRSWDVAACLEGEPGESPRPENEPLADFVRWLHGQSAIPGVEDFLDELGRVEFATPAPFERHAFHPIGIPGHAENPTGSRKAGKALVMSPFLHPHALARIRGNCGPEVSVFSERHELESMPVEALEGLRCHHLDELIVDGESLEAAEEGAADARQQHLHAKLFLFEDEDRTTWFLGSANATRAALERNVEFMLELDGNAPATRIGPRLKELIGEGKTRGPFVPFDPGNAGKVDPAEQALDAASRRFEYALLRSPIHGRVEPSEMGKNFDLYLTINLVDVPAPAGLVLTVQPFNVGPGFQPQRLQPGRLESCEFRNLGEVELSRFLHFRIEAVGGGLQHEFLWRIEIDGLPKNRLENILRKIIDSQDKFFDYLRFLLADEITKEDLLGDVSRGLSGGAEEGWHFQLPIYEQLLVTASRSPSRLADVDEIIGHLTGGESEGVIPASFLSFWEAFRSLIPAPVNSTTP